MATQFANGDGVGSKHFVGGKKLTFERAKYSPLLKTTETWTYLISKRRALEPGTDDEAEGQTAGQVLR